MINKFVLATEPLSPLPVTAIDGTVMLGSAMLFQFVTKEVTFANAGNAATWNSTVKLSGSPPTAAVTADKRKGIDDQRGIGYGGEAS